MTKHVFIADLHLDDAYPTQLDAFRRSIEYCEHERVDALYILGDLFDVWVGDDVVTETAKRVAELINRLSQSGTRVYFQHGNRDFMLGKRFASACGMTLLPTYHVLEHGEQTLLLMHGDVLCRGDWRYQLYRTVVQSSLGKVVIGRCSRQWRIKKGKAMRKNSTRRNHHLDARLMDVTPKAVERAFLRYDANFIIHGHTHQPNTHKHADNTRLVLGTWDEDIGERGVKVVIADANGVRLDTFRPRLSASLARNIDGVGQ